jgi:hypothetical protein
VELLKMRNISRVGETDSVLARLKAGIDAALQLDLVKNRPDFLTLTNNNYRYLSTGMTSIDERTAYIVYFEQKEEVQQPLFRGELYIDTQTYALLGADFEVNPHYVKKASDLFVEKKDRKLAVTPHKITYSVRYKQWGSHYYMDYVRGDLTFRVHRRHRLWSNARLHMWFEMATCKIDTVQVRPFPKSQRLPRRVIFQDVDFPFNDTFWDNFNVIPPETKLSDAIRGMAVKIEEVLRQTEK